MEIKEDPTYVQPFADNLCDYIIQCLGKDVGKNGWCICTTPRRRHKDGFHFATEICRRASEQMKIRFYEDAFTAENRGRIEPIIMMKEEPKEPNVILFDDLLTTGMTVEVTRQKLVEKGHTVLIVAAIRN